jgi:hypothetical protein
MLHFSFQMERQCVQANMEGTFSLPLSVFYNQSRLQICAARVTAKVSDVNDASVVLV